MKRNNIGLVLFCSISHFLKKFKIYKMAASWKGEYENTIDGGFLWEDKIPVSHLDNLKLNLLGQFLKTRTASYIGSQVETYLKPILTVIYRFKCTWKQLEYISMSVLTKVLIPIKALKPVFTIFSFQLIETICSVS